jgi:hypothetical protein
MMALHRSHQDLWNHMLDAHRLKVALSNDRVFFTHSSTLPWACWRNLVRGKNPNVDRFSGDEHLAYGSKGPDEIYEAPSFGYDRTTPACPRQS